MQINPVLENELKRNMRSMRSSWVIFGVNLLLTIVATATYFGAGGQEPYITSNQYRFPIQCYMMMAYTLFAMICLLVPGTAGGCIAIERERRTLDILLTTHLSPWKIIIGKLESSLSMIFLVSFSALPAVSLILVFGGATLTDLFALVFILVESGIYIGSIGIFCSAFLRRTTVATVASYAIILILTVGTAAFLWTGHYIAEVHAVQLGNYEGTDTGAWIGLLLINPLVSYFGLLSKQVGNGYELLQICSSLGDYSHSFVVLHMLPISLVVQMLISGILLYLAGQNVNPLR